MPNPTHHQTNKSQFADDAGQWAVSKNIDLAAKYLQRDLDKLSRWCAKWGIKLNPEKNQSQNILQVPNCNKGRTYIWSLYGDLLSYYPQIKVLGITFDNRMTFPKHFKEIFERCNQQKVGSKSLNNFANLQTMCKTNILIWDRFYHNCFGNCHHQNTKSPELFH